MRKIEEKIEKIKEIEEFVYSRIINIIKASKFNYADKSKN